MQSLKTWSLAVLAFVALVFNPTSERGRAMIDRSWGAAIEKVQAVSLLVDDESMQTLDGNMQAHFDRAQQRIMRSQQCALRAHERMMKLQSERMQRISERVLILQDRSKLRMLDKLERLQKLPCVNSQRVVIVNPDIPDLSDLESASTK
jgi:hypothetical protein